MNAVIEMPKGTAYKYEVDKHTGILKIDRPLKLRVPYNYGFIKKTLAEDGDCLDVFIVSLEPIPPLTEVSINVLGGYECSDNGVKDEKLVATLVGDDVKVDWDILYVISTYLKNYKEGFHVGSFFDKEYALELVKKYTKSK